MWLLVFPDVDSTSVPHLTTEQMVEVDRAMVEDYGIQLMQMMENAGRNLAHLARVRFLSDDPLGKRVAVLAGVGGNGGGALVCARRLRNWGAKVRTFVARKGADFTGVPEHQLRVLEAMDVSVRVGAPPANLEFDLIIDGVIGYSLTGAPRDAAADLIRWAISQSAPVLALDTPSGVDTTNGEVMDPAIRADATMTLALPKEGLRAAPARAVVGELYLADISVPPELYASPTLGLEVGPLFAKSDIVRLR